MSDEPEMSIGEIMDEAGGKEAAMEHVTIGDCEPRLIRCASEVHVEEIKARLDRIERALDRLDPSGPAENRPKPFAERPAEMWGVWNSVLGQWTSRPYCDRVPDAAIQVYRTEAEAARLAAYFNEAFHYERAYVPVRLDAPTLEPRP